MTSNNPHDIFKIKRVLPTTVNAKRKKGNEATDSSDNGKKEPKRPSLGSSRNDTNMDPIPSTSGYAVPVKNRYEQFSSDDDFDSDEPLSHFINNKKRNKKEHNTAHQKKASKPTDNTNKSNENTSNRNSNRPHSDEQTKSIATSLPPIVAYNVNNKTLQQALRQILNHNRFSIKIINRNMTHIYTGDKNDKNTVTDYLKKIAVNCFTYTNKDEKPINIILRHIDVDWTNTEIEEDLQRHLQGDEKVIRVTYLLNFKKEPAHSRIVQFSPQTPIKRILDIEFVLNTCIKWEKLSSTKYTQCRNCQKLGHAAQNCNMPNRCIKCLENHEPGKCKRPSKNDDPSEANKDENVACVNCNEVGHPANYRKCPYYQNYIGRVQENKKKALERTNFKMNSYSNRVNTKLSFAQATRNNEQQQPQYPPLPKRNVPQVNQNLSSPSNNQSNNLDYLQGECHQLFGQDIFDILDKVNEFIPYYKNITSESKKKSAFVAFVISLSSSQP